MRRRSLTTRLTLSHVLVTLAGLAVLGVATLVLVQRSQRAQTLASLSAQARVYAVFAGEVAADTNTLAAIAPTLVRRFSVPADTTVRVFAPNGAVLYASRNDLGAFPSSAALALLPNPLPIQPVTIEGQRRFAAERVIRGAQTLGVVEVSQTAAREQALLQQMLAALVPSAALALLGAALVGHVLARSLVRPLCRLGQVAETIAAGDTTARSQDRSGDEIGKVAAQLNRMADELQSRLAEVERLAAARQEFYRTVSHELRTPLTAIRGTAENLEDDASPEQHDALMTIQSEAARLQRLVEALLSPRDTSMVSNLRRQPVDIAALVADVGRIMQPRAERLGIALSCMSAPNLVVAGDYDRLKQVLLNLLDNALSWTPPGGFVRLAAAQRDGMAQLQVHDSGPGIEPALRERVWERGFTHQAVEPARVAAGQGLGLALVREIVTAHGGNATVLDEPWSSIQVCLPLLDEA